MEKSSNMGVDLASSTPTFWNKVKTFLSKTLNGMTFGIFGTIVVGAIIQTLGIITGIDVLNLRVAPVLTSLLGMGIGLSIGLSLKVDGLKLIMLSVAGGIGTLVKIDFSMPGWFDPVKVSNNPITAYFVVIGAYFAIQAIFRKKTAYDLFFIPIVGILSAVLVTYLISWPIDRFMEMIYSTIKFFMQLEPFVTSAFVALIFGILLTLPFISSAGVAIAVFSVPFGVGNALAIPDPIAIAAMCAAAIGCSTQMVGFSVQTLRKNNLGSIFTVGLASSMFQFKNVMRKPIVWAPTLIASFILAPLSYFIFDGYQWFINLIPVGHQFSAVWAGMGTSGLVGILQPLTITNFSLDGWLFVSSMILFPLVLVFWLDVVFIKLNWYTENDLILDANL
ncbi:PTS transporter subunit IIC [Acholeplasma laidlawii]|uniref:Integral membrane protein n=2 Tax=Acholeplasma laidlawii TaxID=2148 RepID=A9NFH9_ACHLI|nr:PTS sugar transporter subunit IIC [Acholeplasma laidlawii]ABX81109.1 integral membrane protein [Acholeplasma laidlawii PG-8A]NWH10321.1 PTS sugar transporter subunit IIC [Acholeplasma laidlawii]NWH11710.1 PTS sugar transporter subunit IIC [Acholeplasma laidlawii]NWH12882.1 PTS sugar transporter subunit IIC [Acholeplasma laidlawii]NWH15256.1 PTS sugar transporter subunit IIC [Acholeplasma laidlawii]